MWIFLNSLTFALNRLSHAMFLRICGLIIFKYSWTAFLKIPADPQAVSKAMLLYCTVTPLLLNQRLTGFCKSFTANQSECSRVTVLGRIFCNCAGEKALRFVLWEQLDGVHSGSSWMEFALGAVGWSSLWEQLDGVRSGSSWMEFALGAVGWSSL